MSHDFESAEGAARASLERYLAEMFGVVEALESHALWSRRGALWVAPRGTLPPAVEGVEAFGLPVARSAPPRGQLSAAFIRRFCGGATIRVAELTGPEGERFLSGRSVEWADQWPDGPRVVAVDGALHGRGRVRGAVLECELPKQLRIGSPPG